MVSPTPEPDVAPGPVLDTKFFIPRHRPGLVPRTRLVERLERGAGSKLTLVSAPPGFGKTTLLAEWLAAVDELRVAWVSLDQGDNHPATFWTYVITALQTVQLEVGKNAISMLQSPQPPPIETLLAMVLNEVAALSYRLVLVLDDYHVIEAGPIHDGIAFLLDHLPPQMHLVIASRSDPAVPLARLRARGELAEVRAADLRFIPAEAAAFLNGTMGLDLSAENVAALEARTEGWIAALQLAALSMQGRDDLAGFISAFTGDDRYIVDYLVEEVLERQPEAVRGFLLQTSILDRLNGPLCDAVTEGDGGKATLEGLERANLFVVPLDDRRQWYRYHHLFADVLRARLLEDDQGLVQTLRRRATAWYEQQGMPAQAIEQACLGGDSNAVARLLSANYREFESSGQYASISRWAASLPEEMVRTRPRLALIQASTLLRTDNHNETSRRVTAWAEDAIRAIETDGRWNPSDDEDGTVVGFEGLEALKGEVMALKLFHSARTLSLEEVARTAALALQLVPPDNHRIRASLYIMEAGNRTKLADISSALPSLDRAVAEARRAQNPTLLARMLSERGQASVAMGRLDEGRRCYEEALDVGQAASIETSWEMCNPHAWLGEVLLEYGDLAGAINHVAQAVELTRHAPTRSYILFARTAAARTCLSAGDTEAAMEHLTKAQEFVRGSSDSRWVPFLSGVRLTLYCFANDLLSAAALVRERQLMPIQAVSRDNAQEMTAFARYLMARDDHRQAIQVIERVLAVVQGAGRVQDEIQALVLQAIALERMAEHPRALNALSRATMLGEPGHFKRTFTREGEVMWSLLERLVHDVRQRPDSAECGSPSYLSYLQREMAFAAVVQSTPVKPDVAGLAEPLTPREVEILRLVAAGMRNQEIADHLVISLSTVKRHIANTYGKLDAGHRTEAVARASELKLL